jgi:hypothetical protein
VSNAITHFRRCRLHCKSMATLEGKSPNPRIETIRSFIKDLSCSHAEHVQTSLFAKMRLVSESIVLSVLSEHDIVVNKVMQTVGGNVDLHEGCLCVGYINFHFCSPFARLSSSCSDDAQNVCFQVVRRESCQLENLLLDWRRHAALSIVIDVRSQ